MSKLFLLKRITAREGDVLSVGRQKIGKVPRSEEELVYQLPVLVGGGVVDPDPDVDPPVGEGQWIGGPIGGNVEFGGKTIERKVIGDKKILRETVTDCSKWEWTDVLYDFETGDQTCIWDNARGLPIGMRLLGNEIRNSGPKNHPQHFYHNGGHAPYRAHAVFQGLTFIGPRTKSNISIETKGGAVSFVGWKAEDGAKPGKGRIRHGSFCEVRGNRGIPDWSFRGTDHWVSDNGAMTIKTYSGNRHWNFDLDPGEKIGWKYEHQPGGENNMQGSRRIHIRKTCGGVIIGQTTRPDLPISYKATDIFIEKGVVYRVEEKGGGEVRQEGLISFAEWQKQRDAADFGRL